MFDKISDSEKLCFSLQLEKIASRSWETELCLAESILL